jgi:predicted MPP superfamily phosphohydrolase
MVARVPETLRRTALAAGVVAGALAARALWWEPRQVLVRRCEVELPNLPRALDGVRVAVVSDLHAGAPHVGPGKLRRIVSRVNAEQPDLVALLGDFVDPGVALGSDVPPEAVAARLRELSPPLGSFAVLGNHDWLADGKQVAARLRDAGIAVLENDAAAVEARGVRLWLAGLADPSERRPRLDETLALVPEGEPVLLLSHRPDVFPSVPERVSLTLAGHTHGSQVDLPLVRERVTPSRYGSRYAGGLVEERRRRMFVSTGIGTSRLPIRFRAPPELALLTFRSAA